MSGNTVVNVVVKQEVYENLPAFTFCFPQILSFESVANYDEDYKQYYEDYKKMNKVIKVDYSLQQC